MQSLFEPARRLTPAEAEEALVARLRAGDEAAFTQLVRLHHTRLLRLARIYVRTEALAEEVAQDAWLALFRGVGGFEGRSTVKTWLCRVVVNLARTRGVREARSTPLSSLADEGPTVDPAEFRPPGSLLEGHWCSPPARWDDAPDGRLHASETVQVVAAAIAALPPQQAAVMTLRDVEGCDAEETCSALGLTEANQRVLLHRARAKVRAALDVHLRGAR